MGAGGKRVVRCHGPLLDIFVEEGAAIQDHIGRIQPATDDQGRGRILGDIVQRIDLLDPLNVFPMGAGGIVLSRVVGTAAPLGA